MSDQNWRTDVDAGDYFLHQKKQVQLADRRPVIRKGSDLVGPGIGSSAVRLDDYNDLLATFNGYYSSEAGALSAPNGDEAFVGYVISDATFGGRQVFTGLNSGVEFSRTFTRSPVDVELVTWGAWSGARIHATAEGYGEIHSRALTDDITILTPPAVITNIGGVYERTEAGIMIRQQGVYTGSVQVGDVGEGTVGDVYLHVPNGNTMSVRAQPATPLTPTVHIPFTVWVNNSEQGFAVGVGHTTGVYRLVWWKFSCTRIGDAI